MAQQRFGDGAGGRWHPEGSVWGAEGAAGEFAAAGSSPGPDRLSHCGMRDRRGWELALEQGLGQGRRLVVTVFCPRGVGTRCRCRPAFACEAVQRIRLAGAPLLHGTLLGPLGTPRLGTKACAAPRGLGPRLVRGAP